MSNDKPKPATPPEPAAHIVGWYGAEDAANAAPAPEPDEAERVARDFLDHENSAEWRSPGGARRMLAAIIRAAEARGRDAGLSEAARECEAEVASYDSGTHEYYYAGARGCLERIAALRGTR